MVETIALTGVTVVPIRELNTLADIVKWNARLSQSVTGAKTCMTCLLSSTRERDTSRLPFGLWHFQGNYYFSITQRRGGALGPISGDLVFRDELRHL
jgi:hypothetical protein